MVKWLDSPNLGVINMIIKPSVVVKRWPDMSTIEEAARVCYKSEGNKRLYYHIIGTGASSDFTPYSS